MTNEELKKKICDIIAPYVSAYGDDERIADALIAAGIGDVKKRNELKVELRSKIDYIHEQDEVIAYYKHRAEVAERAVREFAVQVGCRSCPYKGRCDISNPSAENDYQECYDAALELAEKELTEERKE